MGYRGESNPPHAVPPSGRAGEDALRTDRVGGGSIPVNDPFSSPNGPISIQTVPSNLFTLQSVCAEFGYDCVGVLAVRKQVWIIVRS